MCWHGDKHSWITIWRGRGTLTVLQYPQGRLNFFHLTEELKIQFGFPSIWFSMHVRGNTLANKCTDHVYSALCCHLSKHIHFELSCLLYTFQQMGVKHLQLFDQKLAKRTPMRNNQQTAWAANTYLFKSLSNGSPKQADKSRMAYRNPKEQEFKY